MSQYVSGLEPVTLNYGHALRVKAVYVCKTERERDETPVRGWEKAFLPLPMISLASKYLKQDTVHGKYTTMFAFIHVKYMVAVVL